MEGAFLTPSEIQTLAITYAIINGEGGHTRDCVHAHALGDLPDYIEVATGLVHEEVTDLQREGVRIMCARCGARWVWKKPYGWSPC